MQCLAKYAGWSVPHMTRANCVYSGQHDVIPFSHETTSQGKGNSFLIFLRQIECIIFPHKATSPDAHRKRSLPKTSTWKCGVKISVGVKSLPMTKKRKGILGLTTGGHGLFAPFSTYLEYHSTTEFLV